MSLTLENHLLKYALVLVAVVGLYIAHRKYIEHKFNKKYGCKSPATINTGFMGVPMLREALNNLKEGTVLEYFQSRITENQVKTYQMYVAQMKLIFTIDPENIKAILATQFNDFALGSRHAHFLPLLGDGIFTLDSHGWKNSRAMLRPQFSREQISHVRSMEPHMQTLASHIRKNAGQVFDIQELFFKFTVDTATDILFGESVYCLRDGTVPQKPPAGGFQGREKFNEAFNITQKTLASRAYSQSFYFLVNSPEFRRCCKIVHGFARYYVDKAVQMNDEELEKKSQSGYTFLYELAKTTKNPKVLQDQLLNIMVAGRDTTAGLLSFTLFELSRNPDVWEKLKQEVYASFGHGSEEDIAAISFESLKKCEYLKYVLNEVLRLYPSVPVNFRDATKDTTLPTGGGEDGKLPVFIPKGTTVAYTIYCTHRMKEIYGEDAEEFVPERWAAQPKLGWAYLPFNGGPRICLGQQFALTEASYVIVRLIQMFPNLTSAYTGDKIPKKLLHLTLSMYDGVPVRMD
ncbi:hypothetical protein PUMCH_001251 [Australozyma saopauloensis]|uniref:Cytochrome P450 n=1 Tax=Australozyma saopauloensis TaxID=291208 RepID=A0AAX4H7Q5_9ASCO|nr:hypothetical protein PUMCH_001251 [[Candida] saopauloensis]